jgi:hypothetical protein
LSFAARLPLAEKAAKAVPLDLQQQDDQKQQQQTLLFSLQHQVTGFVISWAVQHGQDRK